MFLPVKEYQKEIVRNQLRIRKGNRVPQGAVNLAYAQIKPLDSSENVKITDLSNMILENQINNEVVHKLMFPTSSLLLVDDQFDHQLATSDVLITNVFKEETPLFYVHTLAHCIYDKKGTDDFMMYDKTGITIIDKNGTPITQKYRCEIVKNKQFNDLYFVRIYTEFNDVISEDYQVVYNAVITHPDGSITTEPSYHERLDLKPAFTNVENLKDVFDAASKQDRTHIYYATNAEKPYHSSVYVPTPEIKDTRLYERFRYQVGVEVKSADGYYIFTTPWYSNHVIHYDSLSAQEQKEYINGYKQITEENAETIIRQFVPARFFENNLESTMKYFVTVDNPNVREQTRIDGSSPVFVQSTKRDTTLEISNLPERLRINRRPIEQSAYLDFHVRPTKAHRDDMAFISLVMDNSESMAFNDSDKIIRLRAVESVAYSAQQFYIQSKINVNYFANLAKPIQDDFTDTDASIVDVYEEGAPLDNDVTRPERGLEYMENLLAPISWNYSVGGRVYNTKKYIIMVTDGDYEDFTPFINKLNDLKAKGIRVCIVTFNNLEYLTSVCEGLDYICLDGNSQNLPMLLNSIFFKFAGIYDKVKIRSDYGFTTSPTQNDYKVLLINDTLFTFGADVLAEPWRFGVEINIVEPPKVPELSFYIKDKVARTIQPTVFGSNIIQVEEILNKVVYELYVVSQAYNYYIGHVYSVKFNDKTKIKLLMPRQKDAKESWYIRIQNGRFNREQRHLPTKPYYVYSLPEYYRQDFEGDYPIKRMYKERPRILSDSDIQVSATPLAVDMSNIMSSIIVTVNGGQIGIKDFNKFTGIISLDGVISANDVIEATYTYRETSYVYKGYYDTDRKMFWKLDLNPSVGHYVTIQDDSDGLIKDLPSYRLINKVIYFYLKPAAKYEVDAYGVAQPISATNRYTVFHLFEKSTNPEHVLIGELRVRPNSGINNINLFDSRTRGGGILEQINADDIRQYENDSAHYWDIGYWDGQPFPENGIAVIRITRNVLKEYGGKFAKGEVEERVRKHLGYGVLPIIEYLDDPEKLLDRVTGLTLHIVDVPGIGEVTMLKPTFEAEVK